MEHCMTCLALVDHSFHCRSGEFPSVLWESLLYLKVGHSEEGPHLGWSGVSILVHLRTGTLRIPILDTIDVLHSENAAWDVVYFLFGRKIPGLNKDAWNTHDVLRLVNLLIELIQEFLSRCQTFDSALPPEAVHTTPEADKDEWEAVP